MKDSVFSKHAEAFEVVSALMATCSRFLSKQDNLVMSYKQVD